MCLRHWRTLPKRLRNAIRKTYRPGQCDDWRISHEYATAARTAVGYIAGREGKVPDFSVYDMLDPERYNEPVPTPKEGIMPAEVRKTNLLNKMAGRVAKAHEAHKNDETKYGIVDLPSGIKGGYARLQTAKMDQYKEGKLKDEPYVLFRGVAISPEVHGDVRVKGQGVMLMIPLCDTKKMKDGQEVTIPFEQHWGDFLNELRKFGIDTAKMPHTAVDGVLLALQNQKPVYRFSTRGWMPPATARDPNPKEMVFTQFDGIVSDEEEASVGQGSPDSGFAAPLNTVDSNEPSNDDQQGEATAAGDDFDLATTAEQAEQGDMSAIELMKDKAREVGLTEEDIDNSSSWMAQGEGTSLQELIEAKSSGEETSEPEPEPEPAWEPKVGGVCNYTIKAGGKVHQVKVDKIDKKSQTADVTNLGDKKKITKVPLAKLSAA